MNQEQLKRMSKGRGFIAALDQSGGSTPKALKNYGIGEEQYSTDEEMFNLVHEMRTRIITSPSFTSDHILAAILFENTMERRIEDRLTADYLWEVKGIIPILKVDKGAGRGGGRGAPYETYSGFGCAFDQGKGASYLWHQDAFRDQESGSGRY